jgi:hypothetical protein
MNEFLPQTKPVASVVSVKERSLAGAQAKPATSVEGLTDALAQQDTQLTERSAATASYAKLQADIADIVARLEPPRPGAVEQADQALLSLMPQPVVVLPLPPADQEMVEFVAQVAQSLAQQAAMARAAQASVSPALVDTLVH